MLDGHIDFKEPKDLVSFVLGRPIDFDEDEEFDGFDSIPQCREYLESYPLTKRLLGKVISVCLGGDSDTYFYIFNQWGGETNEFDVKSLVHCDLLPNLEILTLIAIYDLNEEEEERVKLLRERELKAEY